MSWCAKGRSKLSNNWMGALFDKSVDCGHVGLVDCMVRFHTQLIKIKYKGD